VAGTPRRLVVYVENLAPRQRDEEQAVKGPPVHAAFDAEGKPTKAALGFARSQGVDKADLQVRDVSGGKYVFAVRRVEGRPAAEVLAEALLGLIAGCHPIASGEKGWASPSAAPSAGWFACWGIR
jgi:glycyl-tRNA synthetase beta subunit